MVGYRHNCVTKGSVTVTKSAPVTKEIVTPVCLNCARLEAEVAALMPHRRKFGEKASHQLPESELGRLALHDELEPVLATAGAD